MNLLTSFIITIACLFQYAASIGKEEHHVPMLKPFTTTSTVAPQDVTQSVATCYQGYTLMSDGTCVKRIVEEPTPAEGDITVPYITRCPAGYIANNGQCQQTSELPLAYFCPAGYDDDGTNCAKEIPGETVTSCDEGELINGICVLNHKAPHLVTPKCPEGSKAERDGNCWKVTETFDCTPKTGKEELHGRVIASGPKAPIPIGKKVVVSKGKEGSRLRALQSKTEVAAATATGTASQLPYTHPSKHSIPGKLVTGKEPTIPPPPAPKVAAPTVCPGKEKEFVSVSPPRATKVAPVSQLCARKVVVDAIAIVSCPEGFDDLGDYCGKQTTTVPTTLCLSSGSTEGACPPIVQKVPKIVQCSDGRQPVNDRCINVGTAPAENVCAEGFKDTGNGCTALVRSGGLECRPGLTLVGNKCIGKSVRPSISMDLRAPAGCEKKY